MDGLEEGVWVEEDVFSALGVCVFERVEVGVLVGLAVKVKVLEDVWDCVLLAVLVEVVVGLLVAVRLAILCVGFAEKVALLLGVEVCDWELVAVSVFVCVALKESVVVAVIDGLMVNVVVVLGVIV